MSEMTPALPRFPLGQVVATPGRSRPSERPGRNRPLSSHAMSSATGESSIKRTSGRTNIPWSMVSGSSRPIPSPPARRSGSSPRRTVAPPRCSCQRNTETEITTGTARACFLNCAVRRHAHFPAPNWRDKNTEPGFATFIPALLPFARGNNQVSLRTPSQVYGEPLPSPSRSFDPSGRQLARPIFVLTLHLDGAGSLPVRHGRSAKLHSAQSNRGN